MKKVLFTSDMVNDNDNVYIPIKGNAYELCAYPLRGDFITCIFEIIKSYRNAYNSNPNVIYIPFIQYNIFFKDATFEKESYFDGIIESYGIYIPIQIMIPDSLKGITAATK